MRQVKFVNNEYYHIFNRGVDKRDIFLKKGDYERFLTTMKILAFDNIGKMLRFRDLQKSNAPRAQLLEFFQELSSGKRLVEIIWCDASHLEGVGTLGEVENLHLTFLLL